MRPTRAAGVPSTGAHPYNNRLPTRPPSPPITGRRPRSADVASAWRSGGGRRDPAPDSGRVWALRRPDLTISRVPRHDGAVVPAHRHAHYDNEACRSTGQHPPPAANTVRAAQDSLLLSNQERCSCRSWAHGERRSTGGLTALRSARREAHSGGPPGCTGCGSSPACRDALDRRAPR